MKSKLHLPEGCHSLSLALARTDDAKTPARIGAARPSKTPPITTALSTTV
ncbi:hypothetical protein ACETKC_11425 [Brevundimonas intermedia]|nr:hypothetical protein [Brevundimonas intermedia]